MKEKIIGVGAEALLIKRGNILEKKRVKKGNRHKQLDLLLRTSRTRHEAKLLKKVSQIIPVPRIKEINSAVSNTKKAGSKTETEIEMVFIQGKLLSEWLDKFSLTKTLKICEKIGKNIALIHDLDIIHGDLTTSNMILHNNLVYFIDFGLGFHSSRIEDKAVDLHLLRESLESRHFKNWKSYFQAVLNGYKKMKHYDGVIEKLKKVESRGRYKRKAKVKQKKPLIS